MDELDSTEGWRRGGWKGEGGGEGMRGGWEERDAGQASHRDGEEIFTHCKRINAPNNKRRKG